MKDRNIFCILAPLLLSGILFPVMAQEPLVLVRGKIVNAETGELVVGRVTYESMPYASKIGFVEGDIFRFHLEQGKSYSVMVRADGFFPYKTKITPEEFVSDSLYRSFELEPDIVGKTIRLEQLIFAISKADITEESYAELNDLAALMDSNLGMIIQLEGHTDTRGDPKLNMKLSQKRVDAVKEYLIYRGISKKRIKTKAFGGTRPLSRDRNSEAHKKNRRVEVRILSN